MTDNMTDKLQREAREAAEEANQRWNRMRPAAVQSHYKCGFRDGYREAATARDKEIEELRARVKELEERAAQWVPESGLKSLMDQGWTEFYNDKRGNEPRLWLMVPPIPLPEGKS